MTIEEIRELIQLVNETGVAELEVQRGENRVRIRKSFGTETGVILQSSVPAQISSAKKPLETMEHLAILKRWYYRGTRIGEIFFADAKGDLPMRRVVRGLSRVFHGDKQEPEPAQPHGQQPMPS